MNNRRRLFLAVITAASFFLSHPTVAEKVVVVPLFDTSPVGVAAIPVSCSEAVLNDNGNSILLDCTRSDDRSSVMPVPEGHFFFVTDIWTNRNSLVTSGRAFVSIGRNNGTFITSPRYDFSIANVSQSFHVNWSSPYLVFGEGERIRAANGDVSDSSVNVDIFVSGYLVRADRFGG